MARATGGYIKLHRKILQNEFLMSDWRLCWGLCLLIMWARWRDDEHVLKRQKRALKRGECVTSAKDLGSHFGYETAKAAEHGGARILNRLEELKIIRSERGNCGTIVSIINYEAYQGEDGEDPGADTGATTGATTGTGTGAGPGHKKNSRTKEPKNLKQQAAAAVTKAFAVLESIACDGAAGIQTGRQDTLDRIAAACGTAWPAVKPVVGNVESFYTTFKRKRRARTLNLFKGDVIEDVIAMMAADDQNQTQIDDKEIPL